MAQEASPPSVTLEEAIRLALDNDPAAIAAEAAVETASAGLLEARGAWLPSLNVGSAYANSSNERFDQTTGQLVSQNYSAQVSANYTLFSGGRRLAQHRAVRRSRAHQHRVRLHRLSCRDDQQRAGERLDRPARGAAGRGLGTAHFCAGAEPMTVKGTAPSVTCPSAAITFQRAW